MAPTVLEKLPEDVLKAIVARYLPLASRARFARVRFRPALRHPPTPPAHIP